MVVTNELVSATITPEALLLQSNTMHNQMMDVCRSFSGTSSATSPLHSHVSTLPTYHHSPSAITKSMATTNRMTTPSPLLRLMRRANSFVTQGMRSRDGHPCVPLMIAGRQVGMLLPTVLPLLLRYRDVFTFGNNAVELNPQLTTYSSRTSALASALQHLREDGSTVALRSWRGENFVVWGEYGGEALCEVERAAVALLGIRSYGVHITGFVRGPDEGVAGVWLQKRADNKPTYPGMMDTMVAGGLTGGLTPTQVLYKEAAEEASLPSQLVDRALPVGTVSFFTETERGLHANTEYVYEVELPRGFEPSPNDGEAEGFALININDILDYVLNPNFKLTSTPILVDFLIRHGIVTSDMVPDLPQITEMLHTPLHFFYNHWPQFTMPDSTSMYHVMGPVVALPSTSSAVSAEAAAAAEAGRDADMMALQRPLSIESNISTGSGIGSDIEQAISQGSRSEDSDINRDESGDDSDAMM